MFLLNNNILLYRYPFTYTFLYYIKIKKKNIYGLLTKSYFYKNCRIETLY